VTRSYLIAIGGNLHSDAMSPAEMVQSAVEKLRQGPGALGRVSRFFRTPAFPAGAGPDFVNAALELSSDEAPEQLMARLHDIEQSFGRVRATRWGPRSLDLDLVAGDDLVLPDVATQAQWRALPAERQSIDIPDRLILPHPRVQDRAFVLVPLCDVAPQWMHPLLGLTVAQMCENLPQSDRDCVVALPESACQ
jgi:2-amino-4-hydroxy-6-hydroxymethyldihydropteridine diphosphokinase